MTALLDANCFKGYIDSVIAGRNDVFVSAVEKIKEKTHLATDSGEILLQEWRECTGSGKNIFIEDIIGAWLQEGMLRFYDFKRDGIIKKMIRLAGVNAKDSRLFEFSCGAQIDVILSHDVDLFEPSIKNRSDKKLRYRAIHERKGDVCSKIEKNFSIVICCCCRAGEFI